MAKKQTISIDLGLNKQEMGRTLRGTLYLETDKGYNGGVRSDATVFWIGGGSRIHCFSMGAAGGDYNARVAELRSARATQKAIDGLHAQTFTPTAIAQIKDAAIAHYRNDVNVFTEGMERARPSDAGAMVAEYMEETGCDATRALIACNCD